MEASVKKYIFFSVLSLSFCTMSIAQENAPEKKDEPEKEERLKSRKNRSESQLQRSGASELLN